MVNLGTYKRLQGPVVLGKPDFVDESREAIHQLIARDFPKQIVILLLLLLTRARTFVFLFVMNRLITVQELSRLYCDSVVFDMLD